MQVMHSVAICLPFLICYSVVDLHCKSKADTNQLITVFFKMPLSH